MVVLYSLQLVHIFNAMNYNFPPCVNLLCSQILVVAKNFHISKTPIFIYPPDPT
jgi:hypothetical protein